MTPSKKVEKIASVEKLDYIQTHVCSITERRIQAAVQSMHKSKEIMGLLLLFSQLNNVFAEESDNLKSESTTYNQRYATPVNGKFSTGQFALETIKKQVFFLYHLIYVTTPRPKEKRGFPKPDKNSLEHKVDNSNLGNKPYTAPIFNCELEIEKRLVAEIKSFMHYLDKNLELCKRIVAEEESIDEIQARALLEKQVDEVYEYTKEFKPTKKILNEDFYQELIHFEEHPGAFKKWFHKLDLNNFSHVAWGMKNQVLSKYSILERKIFEDDINKLQIYRKVMAHLDKVTDKITGEIIVYVQRYTKCNASQNAFLNCFADTYKSMGGQQKIITPQRYNQAYTLYYYDEERYREFQLKMDSCCSMAA